MNPLKKSEAASFVVPAVLFYSAVLWALSYCLAPALTFGHALFGFAVTFLVICPLAVWAAFRDVDKFNAERRGENP